MSIEAKAGPLIVFGRGRVVPTSTGLGQALEYNPDAGPSLGELLWGMMDIRPQFCYQPGTGDTQPFYGFVGGQLTLVDQAPSTASATNIAAAQVPVAATPLTLVSSTGGGITVGTSVVNALTGVLVTGLLAIDGAAGTANAVGFGASKRVNIWDPTKALSRTLVLTAVGNDSSGTYLVSGYDVYGFPITQLVTGPNATTGSTLKAFKYIASIVPAGTLSGSNISVGTNDVFGLPLRADAAGYLDVTWNSVKITTLTTFTAAVTTSPSTNLLGDTRGTIGVPSASDGTKAMQLFWRPKVANLALGVVGIYGVQNV